MALSYDPKAHGARCDICPLRKKRFVPPEGPADADIGVFGEAPGPQEEIKRRPFIGPSGILLGDILKAAGGLPRERVWISNALLCRAEVPNEKGKKRYDLRRYLAWLSSVNKKETAQAKKEKRQPRLLPSPFLCCRPRLLAELRMLEEAAVRRGQPNGAVIVPVGNYSTYAIAGKSGILKWRGSPLVESEHFKLTEELPSAVKR